MKENSAMRHAILCLSTLLITLIASPVIAEEQQPPFGYRDPVARGAEAGVKTVWSKIRLALADGKPEQAMPHATGRAREFFERLATQVDKTTFIENARRLSDIDLTKVSYRYVEAIATCRCKPLPGRSDWREVDSEGLVEILMQSSFVYEHDQWLLSNLF